MSKPGRPRWGGGGIRSVVPPCNKNLPVALRHLNRRQGRGQEDYDMLKHPRRSRLAAFLAAGLTVGAALLSAIPAAAAPAGAKPVTVGPAASAALLAATTTPATSPAPAGATPVAAVPPDTCLYGNCSEQTFCSDGTCVPGPPPACYDGYCIPQTPLCYDGYCVPQAWYVATSVITNGGLYQLGAAAPYVNTTSVTQSESRTLTITGSLTATLNGTFGVSGEAVSGAVAQVQPGVQASVSGSYAVAGTLNVPPGSVGYLYYGIVYVQTSGTVYSVDVSGHISTVAANVVATVPVNWGFLGETEPYIGNS
jgi:hypothetical protein